MAQRYKEQILDEIPEVDAVIGVNEYEKIADIIEEVENGCEGVIRCTEAISDIEKPFRIRTTPSYTAYLKIADGCDNFCTYCIIPKLRGKFRSRPVQSILDEAKSLGRISSWEPCRL